MIELEDAKKKFKDIIVKKYENTLEVDSLEELKNSSALRKKISENAFKDFENKYTWDMRARNLTCILDSI